MMSDRHEKERERDIQLEFKEKKDMKLESFATAALFVVIDSRTISRPARLFDENMHSISLSLSLSLAKRTLNPEIDSYERVITIHFPYQS